MSSAARLDSGGDVLEALAQPLMLYASREELWCTSSFGVPCRWRTLPKDSREGRYPSGSEAAQSRSPGRVVDRKPAVRGSRERWPASGGGGARRLFFSGRLASPRDGPALRSVFWRWDCLTPLGSAIILMPMSMTKRLQIPVSEQE